MTTFLSRWKHKRLRGMPGRIKGYSFQILSDGTLDPQPDDQAVINALTAHPGYFQETVDIVREGDRVIGRLKAKIMDTQTKIDGLETEIEELEKAQAIWQDQIAAVQREQKRAQAQAEGKAPAAPASPGASESGTEEPTPSETPEVPEVPEVKTASVPEGKVDEGSFDEAAVADVVVATDGPELTDDQKLEAQRKLNEASKPAPKKTTRGRKKPNA